MNTSDHNFRLIVISSPEMVKDETRYVRELLDSGLSCFHLRKPGWNKESLRQYLEEIPPEFYGRIILHYREGIEGMPALGTHVPLAVLKEPKTGDRHPVRSTSVHSWEEYKQAQPQVDFAFISPFFDSISKKGYRANPELFNVPPGIMPDKAVALGGITTKNMDRVRRLGLGGAAMLGYIWDDPYPLKAWGRIQKQVLI